MPLFDGKAVASKARRAMPALSLAGLLALPWFHILKESQMPAQRALNEVRLSHFPEFCLAVCALCLFLVVWPLFSDPPSPRLRTIAAIARSALLIAGLWLLCQYTGITMIARRALGRSAVPIAPAVFAVLLSAVQFWLFRRHCLARAQEALLAILFPFVVFHFVSTLAIRLGPSPNQVRAAPAKHPPGIQSGRALPGKAVFLIFDEMDGELAFSRRPPDISLPHFDRLAHESFFFEEAFPPAGWTVLSIGAYLTGRPADRCDARDAANPRLRTADTHEWLSLRDSDRIFSLAHALKTRVEAYGWYIPYCQAFSNLLTGCEGLPSPGANWESSFLRLLEPADGGTVLRALLSYQLYWFVRAPLTEMFFPPEWDRRTWTSVGRRLRFGLDQILPRVARSLASPGSAFIYIHIPVPHPPNLRGDGGYAESFQHADAILGLIRRALESSSEWSQSALIVTSDHSLRPFWRDYGRGAELKLEGRSSHFSTVPLIVKAPGAGDGERIRGPINSMVAGRLVEFALAGQLNRDTLRHCVEEFRARQPGMVGSYPF